MILSLLEDWTWVIATLPENQFHLAGFKKGKLQTEVKLKSPEAQGYARSKGLDFETLVHLDEHSPTSLLPLDPNLPTDESLLACLGIGIEWAVPESWIEKSLSQKPPFLNLASSVVPLAKVLDHSLSQAKRQAPTLLFYTSSQGLIHALFWHEGQIRLSQRHSGLLSLQSLKEQWLHFHLHSFGVEPSQVEILELRSGDPLPKEWFEAPFKDCSHLTEILGRLLFQDPYFGIHPTQVHSQALQTSNSKKRNRRLWQIGLQVNLLILVALLFFLGAWGILRSLKGDELNKRHEILSREDKLFERAYNLSKQDPVLIQALAGRTQFAKRMELSLGIIPSEIRILTWTLKNDHEEEEGLSPNQDLITHYVASLEKNHTGIRLERSERLGKNAASHLGGDADANSFGFKWESQ